MAIIIGVNNASSHSSQTLIRVVIISIIIFFFFFRMLLAPDRTAQDPEHVLLTNRRDRSTVKTFRRPLKRLIYCCMALPLQAVSIAAAAAQLRGQ